MLTTKKRTELTEIMKNLKWMFSVYKDDASGEYFFEVLCGGIAMYERAIRMSAEEVKWVENGDAARLERLSSDVCQSLERFADRETRLV